MNIAHSYDFKTRLSQFFTHCLEASLCSRFGLSAALMGTLGVGVVWIPQVVTPPAAVAYTSRLNLFLTREADESFEVFIQRAEIVARAAVQRSFDADVVMTDAIVTVVGDYQGIAVPILTIDVSRSEWQRRPDVEYWATYYEAAEGLMSSGM
jgi:hypothetical protein